MRLFSRSKGIVAALLAIVAGTTARSAQAIIVYGNQGRNTVPATGQYANSGAQFAAFPGGYNNIGEFIAYGTVWPVAPEWFLAPSHTSGAQNIGSLVYQDGVPRTIIDSVLIRDAQGNPTDLTLQRVDTPFARYAPMYTGSDEVGKDLVVYGTGINIKGDVLTAEGSNTPAGWAIKDGTGILRAADQFAYGLNQVARTVDVRIQSSLTNTLYATFDKPTLDDGSANPASKGDNEAMAGYGDSGGGVFINNNGEWQLAGIIYAIDGGIYSSPTATGPGVAFLYDYRGFYEENSQRGRDLVTGPDPIGVGFYSSRVSAYQTQLRAVTGAVVIPEASTSTLLALGTAALGLVGTQVRRKK